MLDDAEAARVEKNAELSMLRSEMAVLKEQRASTASLQDELSDLRDENERLQSALRAAQRGADDTSRLKRELDEAKTQLMVKTNYCQRLEVRHGQSAWW